AVLPATLDNVAGLDEYLKLGRDIFQLQLVDRPRLMDDDLLLLERFLEGQELLAGVGVLAVDEIDRQVLVDKRPRKGPSGGGSGRFRQSEPPRDCSQTHDERRPVTCLHGVLLSEGVVPS